MSLDWSSIVLAVVTALTGCGWFLDRRKHNAEVGKMNMDLADQFVSSYKEKIVAPMEGQLEDLKKEVSSLRRGVKRLENAIQKINDCPHSAQCPVYDELQKQPDGIRGARDGEGGKEQQ